MDVIELFDRAHDKLGAVISRIESDDMGRQSPCAAWTVRDEVNKVVASLQHNTTALREGRYDDEMDLGAPPDLVGNDAMGRYRQALADCRAAYTADGVMERTVPAPVPGVDLPVDQLLGVRIFETTVVTWDLARSIGVDPDLDDDQVEFAQQIADFVIPAVAGAPDRARFADSVDLPSTASATDRLIASTGRDPAWSNR